MFKRNLSKCSKNIEVRLVRDIAKNLRELQHVAWVAYNLVPVAGGEVTHLLSPRRGNTALFITPQSKKCTIRSVHNRLNICLQPVEWYPVQKNRQWIWIFFTFAFPKSQDLRVPYGPVSSNKKMCVCLVWIRKTN